MADDTIAFLERVVGNFLTNEPVPTVAPIRRAPGPDRRPQKSWASS
jgi:hypothetical protein